MLLVLGFNEATIDRVLMQAPVTGDFGTKVSLALAGVVAFPRFITWGHTVMFCVYIEEVKGLVRGVLQPIRDIQWNKLYLRFSAQNRTFSFTLIHFLSESTSSAFIVLEKS